MGSYILIPFSVWDIFTFQKFAVLWSVGAAFGWSLTLSYRQATGLKAMALTVGSLSSAHCVGCSSEGVMILCPTLPRSECETAFSRRPSKSSGQYECRRTMPRLRLINHFVFLVWYLPLNLHEELEHFIFWPKFLFFLLSFLPRSSLSTCGSQGLSLRCQAWWQTLRPLSCLVSLLAFKLPQFETPSLIFLCFFSPLIYLCIYHKSLQNWFWLLTGIRRIWFMIFQMISKWFQHHLFNIPSLNNPSFKKKKQDVIISLPRSVLYLLVLRANLQRHATVS